MKKLLFTFLITISGLTSQSLWASEQLISVNGTGEVSTIPDQLQFTVLLQQKGPSSAKLNQILVNDSQLVVEALRHFHVADKDIQSMQVQLSPWYQRQADGMQQKGFVLSRKFQITLRKLDNYDRIIDQILSIGAARVDNFQYLSSKSSHLYDQALQEAIADATKRAKIISKSAGVKLGKVISVTENSVPARPVVQMRMMAMKESNDSYQPGEMSVQARVHMIFSIASQ